MPTPRSSSPRRGPRTPPELETTGIDWVPGRRVFASTRRELTREPTRREGPVPGLVTNGELVDGSALAIRFRPGEGDVYQVRLELDEPLDGATGVSARLKVSGWTDIRYVAIGTYGPHGFTHVKVRHVRQDEWITLGFDLRDLAFRTQNPQGAPPLGAIGNVMLYLKGAPSLDASELEVEWVAATAAGDVEIGSEAPDPSTIDAVASALRGYAAGASSGWRLEAEDFLANGTLHIVPGTTRAWTPDGPSPVSVDDNPTLRYSWHALAPARSLLLLAAEGREDAATAADRLVRHWVRESYVGHDPDQRYVWYDHGTAERALVLALALLARPAARSEEPVPGLTLEELLALHSQLLASETFYAANQDSRFHNHALFQDLVLLASSHVSRSTAAPSWRRIALYRLREQLRELVHVTDGLAVLVENSIGYHHVVVGLVELAARLEEAGASAGHSSFTELLDAMNEFSRVCAYPGGGAPAQGDTYAAGSGGRSLTRTRIGSRRAALLPEAGYGLVHSAQYSLMFFATGLSATHKHCDNLSFTFFADGIEWLIDPSFYSHEYDAPVPAYLRGPWAHNALVVADSEYDIEPGLVELKGRVGRRDFIFEGTHRGFRDHEVSRVVRGTAHGPELHIEDRYRPTATDVTDRDAYVVLHLGEHVSATPGEQPGSHILSHPGTSTTVVVSLPGVDAETVTGWNGTPRTSSVAGTGFQKSVDTTSILVPVPSGGRALAWTLAVRSRERRRRPTLLGFRGRGRWPR